jgi:hypothetical protein
MPVACFLHTIIQSMNLPRGLKMRITTLFIVAILIGCSGFYGPLHAQTPTGCQFLADGAGRSDKAGATAPAMQYLAVMARAKDEGDIEGGSRAGRQAAQEIASYPSSTVEIFLDVADGLSPLVISEDAHLALARALLDYLHPIASQTFESQTGILHAYLKAHYQLHLFSDDRFDLLDDVEAKIMAADICRERRFFLLLELSRHVGENYDQPLARKKLVSLRRGAEYLKGISRENLPMKWYALMRLTYMAARIEAFDMVEEWLIDTILEEETLKNSGTANVAVLQEVKEMMLNLPEYIASQHTEYQKRNPVDMK